MTLPFFYAPDAVAGQPCTLDENNSRHAIAVLRMAEGEQLHLTDGKGHLHTAVITSAHKKHCVLRIDETRFTPPPPAPVTIAVSLLKNVSRLEWFLEKATEMGVFRIRLLLCKRTEKQQVRFDRLQQILVSAMLQSQQVWLPEMEAPLHFAAVLSSAADQRYIAHCVDTERLSLRAVAGPGRSSLLLIGPEGDFTPEEIEAALAAGFLAVTLGESRLRTETAAVVGASLLCIF